MAILKENNSSVLTKLRVIRNRVERYVIWQRRCYDHNCRSEESIWEIINYCHNNPVMRGLVDSPEKWEWSSYRHYHDLGNIKIAIDMVDKFRNLC